MEEPRETFLTPAHVEAVFEEFTYLPGWRFVLQHDPHEGLFVRIQATVENSYQPGKTTDLDIISPLPFFRTERDVELWLSWRLARIATHESREFLKRNGKVVSDPHAEPPRT